MRILLVRHGQTDLNITTDQSVRKMQGQSNLDLNQTGIEQAYICKELLKNEHIDLIISSPLIRAVHTAAIINEERRIPMILDDALKEMNLGEIEGKEVKDEYWDLDYDYQSIGGENIPDFMKRIYTFLDRIIRQYPNYTILITAHGGVSRAMKCYFEGIPESNNIADCGIKNCEIKEFKIQ